MKKFKGEQWNRWMFDSIPMLDNQTPLEAAQTPQGKRKLEELFALYDERSSGMEGGGGGGMNCNIPTRYARWKLGFGPGSEVEFAEEEEIFNHAIMNDDGMRTTQRKQRHTKKLEKKKAAIWIPRRCEVPGCSKRGEDVKVCSKCQCAYYCGREHQAEDWKRHKLDCKALKKASDYLQPRSFLPSRELEKYPIGCFPVPSSTNSTEVKANAKAGGAKCFVCHSSSLEVDITYTECCNLPVCDNSHEYQMMSYSRDFCQRSHDRYTSCASHCQEEHKGDWRDCVECNNERDGARPFYSTNGFCATPCLEKFLPQGSMITFGCDSEGCKNRMIPGHSGVCYNPDGTTVCTSCSD